MATDFTPGPWKRSRTAPNYIISVADNGQTVARVVEFIKEHVAEQVANANLIAAAPDLYAELEHARELLALKGVIVDAIDNVLARARGEQVSA